jgi:hypothetical protein
MSAPLQALIANILANTLTSLEQNALANALTIIAPVFPGPDETGSTLPPPDEVLAREWIAALYAIQAGNGGGPPPVGNVNSVSGTAPIVVSPTTGDTVVSIEPATTAAAGSMSATDKLKLDNLPGSITGETLTDDLAGSTLAAPFVAALSGPAGAPGDIPVQAGSSLSFRLGSGDTLPTTGVLRMGSGLLQLIVRSNGPGDDRNLVWMDAGAPTFGNISEAAVRYYCGAVELHFMNDVSAFDNSGGVWGFWHPAGRTATFFADDQTYEWQQGTPGYGGTSAQDGICSRFNFLNTHSTAADQEIANILLVDNAITELEVTLLVWDLTASPYQWATFVLTQTYSSEGGTITASTAPVVVVAGGHSTGSGPVNPDLQIVTIAGQEYVQLIGTPWTANQCRWQGFAKLKVISDVGDD